MVPVAPSSARYARNVSRAGAVGGAAARRRGGESVWALAAVASRSAWGRRRIRRVGGRSALAAGSAAAPPLDRSRFLLIQAEAPILQDRMLHCGRLAAWLVAAAGCCVCVCAWCMVCVRVRPGCLGIPTVLFMKFDSTVLSRISVSAANANPPDDQSNQQNAPVKNQDPDGTF